MLRRIVLILVLANSAAAAAAEIYTWDQERQAQFTTLQRLISKPKKHRQPRFDAQAFRREALILPSDRDPADAVLRRTAALLAALKRMPGAPDLAAEGAALERLQAKNAASDVKGTKARRDLFDKALDLRRKIAFANPLLDFDKILFIKRHFLPGSHRQGNHMCDQYFGFHAIRGGGVYVLEGAFSGRPTVRDVLADSLCRSGRFKGKKLPPGGYLSPELSFDARTVLFAFTEAEPSLYQWTERSTYHLFKVGIDGSGLVQLTDGPASDFDPCWLPNGRIVFISERRGGFGRCHARPVPIFTLHTMEGDGTDITCISRNESNEWHPSVDASGMIVYTRWDYVDRGHSQAHHPWITTPDGRDARAIQGNFGQSMQIRPFMEMDMRAIPLSHKYIATAAAHHGQAYGSLVVLDPWVEDDDAMAPLKRLTPDVWFPEAERGETVYAAAWPLSEDFYLCVCDFDATRGGGPKNNFGLYLLDAWGNKELIYRDPQISCLSPIPVRRRRRPPVIPHVTAEGKPQMASATPDTTASPPEPSDTAPVGLVNVYDGFKPWPEGAVIKALRIIQVLPKATPVHNVPRIGYGSEKGARAVLGTVPVEADGSAHFSLPVGVPVFFQALDGRGLAVQSMRSCTYVHPGQRLVCQGCHEPRHRGPQQPKQFPLAMRRSPSTIVPDVAGSNPFSFPRLVQPVIERHCTACHAKEPKAMDLAKGDAAKNRYGWYTSYANLRTYAFYFGKFEATYDGWTPPRTTPGEFGARASKLLALLEKGHYDVKLPREDLHRITLWLDCNSDFLGSYEDPGAQARGEIVRPTLQ
jgi:hypothetical protein